MQSSYVTSPGPLLALISLILPCTTASAEHVSHSTLGAMLISALALRAERIAKSVARQQDEERSSISFTFSRVAPGAITLSETVCQGRKFPTAILKTRA